MAKQSTNRKTRKSSPSRNQSSKKRSLPILLLVVTAISLMLYYPEEINTIINSDKDATTELIETIANEENNSIKTETNTTEKPTTNSRKKKQKVVNLKDQTCDLSTLQLPAVSDSTYLYYNKEGRFYVMFDTKNKIPQYVAYLLTREEVKANNVKRYDKFEKDYHYLNIGVDQAENSDYLRSGYDRGHMLPSADRNDAADENRATFLFSNITPQMPKLNRQTISQLEKQVRKWSLKYDSLYVVTGSILSDNTSRPIKKIGKGVAVPQYIYKVIAVRSDDGFKTIGFIMPNIESVSTKYNDYIESVDNIEEITGIDFFHKLPDHIEDSCEKEVDTKFWK